jgi:hypothetical protein
MGRLSESQDERGYRSSVRLANDSLPTHRRQVTWPHIVDGRPSAKDLIESLGVPHPEIDLILVNAISVAITFRN